MPPPNPIPPKEQPKSQGIMSPIVSERTIDLSEDRETRLKQLQQARADATGGGGIMDHFAYNLLNPAVAFQQAKDEGRLTLQPVKKVPPEEAEFLKETVPEELRSMDNIFLTPDKKQKLIEQYEKGKGAAQNWQLAVPAILEIGHIDLLTPGSAPGGATVGSRPLIRSLGTFAKDTDAKLTNEVQNTIIQQTSQGARPLVTELLDTFKQGITGDISDQTVKQFEEFVNTTFQAYKPVANIPSDSMAEHGLDYIGIHADSVDMNKALAQSIAVKMEGMAYIPYKKSFVETTHSTIEIPIKRLHLSTAILEGGNFGHYRTFNFGDGVAIHEIQPNDSFKPYNITYKNTDIGAPKMLADKFTTIKHPKPFEVEAIIAAHKMFGNSDQLIKKIYDNFNLLVPYTPGTSFSRETGQVNAPLILVSLLEKRPDGYMNRIINRIRTYTNGAYDPSIKNIDNFYELHNTNPTPEEVALAAFQSALDAEVQMRTKTRLYQIQEELLPIPEIAPTTFTKFKKDYNFLLKDGKLTLPEKTFASMSLSPKLQNHQVLIAALQKAKADGKQFMLLPKVDTANKVGNFTSQVSPKFKIPFMTELLKESPKAVQLTYQRGFFNGPTFGRSILFTPRRYAFEGSLTLDSVDTKSFVNNYVVLNPGANQYSKMDLEKAGTSNYGTNSIKPGYGNIAYLDLINLATTNKLIDFAEYYEIKKFDGVKNEILGTPENLTPVYKSGAGIFSKLKTPDGMEFKKEIAEKMLSPELILSVFYNTKADSFTALHPKTGQFPFEALHPKTANTIIDMSNLESKLDVVLTDPVRNDQISEEIFLNILRPLNKALVPDSKDGYFASKKEMYAGINNIMKDKIDFFKSTPVIETRKLIEKDFNDVLDRQMDMKYLDLPGSSYHTLEAKFNVIDRLYKNVNRKNNFATKDNTADALKKTNMLPIVKNYYDYPIRLLKDAGIQYSDFTDEFQNNWYRVELEDVTLEQINNYKATLFTKTILPRIKSEENKRNEKIKQYIKQNPYQAGDVL